MRTWLTVTQAAEYAGVSKGRGSGAASNSFKALPPTGRENVYQSWWPTSKSMATSISNARRPAQRRAICAAWPPGWPIHLASWMGACPGNEESAGVNYSHRYPKGNRQMRRVLNQAANAAVKASREALNGATVFPIRSLGRDLLIWLARNSLESCSLKAHPCCHRFRQVRRSSGPHHGIVR
jgi:hypothetical protein